MDEANLTIVVNGQYKNIKLNEKKVAIVDGEQVQTNKYLLDDKYIIIEKVYNKGLKKPSKFGNDYWLYQAKYKDQTVSFSMNRSQDADALDNLGIAGDKIRISGQMLTTQAGRAFLRLSFELLK